MALIDFIDRSDELELLKTVLSREIPERVLAFPVRAESGKTYLMTYFKEYCEECSRPVALIDFDTRQRGAITYWKFVNLLVDELGVENFEEVLACQKRHEDIPALLNIQTGSGQAGIDFGANSHFEHSEISSIAGRDQIDLRGLSINNQETRDSSASRREKHMHEMGRALRSDLHRLSKEKPIILILDTYEMASKETRDWIDEWILSLLPSQLPNLVLIIAGRPELREFFVDRRPWHLLLNVRSEFGNPTEEDIYIYAQKNGLQLGAAEITVFLKVAQSNIATLARLRDIYRQQRW